MAFLIHAVSASATGREIRRSHRIESDRLTIGRDPASDIVLADLEVTLQHAEIVRTGPHRAVVRSLVGLPFTIDGRSTLESDVDARAGAEVRIGGFRLEIAWDEGEQAIGITVERHGLVAASSQTRDERRLYTLAGVAPSRRIMAWAGAILVFLIFLAWPIAAYHAAHQAKLTPQQMVAGAAGFHGDRTWSAGPLSRAHAGLANNCTACHAEAFVSVRDESCKACHATVHDHADPRLLQAALRPTTLGGKLSLAVAHAFNRPAGRCIDCHNEHQGDVATAAPDQKFCADCHGDLKARLPETRLGDASDFGRVHPQFQPAILVRPGTHPVFQRMSLDAHPKQETGLLFPHDLHLSATGGVARMAQSLGQVKSGGLDCAGCHTPDPQSGGFLPVTMEKDCQSCHSLAFGRREGQLRTLRHGDVAQAIGQVRDFYAAGGGMAVQPLAGFTRARPGDQRATGTAPMVYPAGNADRAVHALFAPNGACADCHRITGPSRPGALDYKIAPVTLPDHFFVNGWFDHRAHTTESCESCHGAARSHDARDVMIPDLANCRGCHVGATGAGVMAVATGAKAKVASDCALCHVYHRDERRAPTADRRQGKGTPAQPLLAASVKESG